MSLIELAVGFVVNHPAVASPIIGPRTLEQLDSDLPTAEITLDLNHPRPRRRDRQARRR